MKALATCPDCGRPLEPATLNKSNRWCSVCAVEFNASGGRVISKAGGKPGESVAVPAPETPPAASVSHAEVPVTAALRRFRVAIGQLSFEVADNAALDIGGTKVVITAL